MEYLVSEITLDEQKQKFCDTHKDQPVSFGCAKCWMVYCPDCLSSIGTCGDSRGMSDFLDVCRWINSKMQNFIFVTLDESACFTYLLIVMFITYKSMAAGC